jgi:hypothetical protein
LDYPGTIYTKKKDNKHLFAKNPKGFSVPCANPAQSGGGILARRGLKGRSNEIFHFDTPSPRIKHGAGSDFTPSEGGRGNDISDGQQRAKPALVEMAVIEFFRKDRYYQGKQSMTKRIFVLSEKPKKRKETHRRLESMSWRKR